MRAANNKWLAIAILSAVCILSAFGRSSDNPVRHGIAKRGRCQG